jgi:hypothetical protein
MPGVSTGVPLAGSAIFRPRREGKVEARIGREEAKAGGQDTGHRVAKSVYAELSADYVRVGIEMLPPVSVGENDHFGLFIGRTSPGGLRIAV